MNSRKQILDHFYEGLTRPMVYGHRGAMAYAPMNTIASFELALAQGADAIELDVWLTQDDVPVIIHDIEVNHTTDGEGRVGSMPLAALKELDAGSWFSPEYAGQRIPTLDEVFEAVGQKLWINVEIKSIAMDNTNVIWHTVECIRRHNMSQRVIISCFNPMVLRQLQKVAPEIPRGYLVAEDVPAHVRAMMFGVGHEAWHPERVQVTPERVAQMHKRGLRVQTWTVNDPQEALKLRDYGVDAVMTDNPDKILAAFGAS